MIIKNNRLRKRKFLYGGTVTDLINSFLVPKFEPSYSLSNLYALQSPYGLLQSQAITNVFGDKFNSGITSSGKTGNIGALNKGSVNPAMAGVYGAGFKLTNDLITNKLSKAGNALVGIGGAVATVNPLIGGAIATLGTLANLGFGNDEKKLAKYNEVIGNNAAYNVDGSSTGSVVLASSRLPSTTKIDRGAFGWFNGSDYRRFKKDMATSNEMANTQLTHGTSLANKNITDNAMRNVAAFGGPLSMLDTGSSIGYELANRYLDNGLLKALNKGILNDSLPSVLALGGDMQSHGLNFPTGMIHIDKGGTHETNPYEGVPMGVDQEGTPNLVEEGETVYNDYVFSNRLTVPIKLTGKNKKLYAKGGKLYNEVTYEDKVLKQFEGMTYADAAKKAEGGIMGHDYNNQLLAPRNPYDQQALEAVLQVLASSQELVKQEEQTLLIQEMVAQMSPEEQEMLMREMVAQQLQAPQELMENPQFMPEELYSPYQQPDAGLQYIDSYGNMMAACGGKLRAKGGNLNVPVETIFNQPLLSKANLFKEGGPMDEKALRRWLRRQYRKKGIDVNNMTGVYKEVFDRDLLTLVENGNTTDNDTLFINRFQVPQDKKQLDLAFRDTIRREQIDAYIGNAGRDVVLSPDGKSYMWNQNDAMRALTEYGPERVGNFTNNQWTVFDRQGNPRIYEPGDLTYVGEDPIPDVFGEQSIYKKVPTVANEDWGLDISHYGDNIGWINPDTAEWQDIQAAREREGGLPNTFWSTNWLDTIVGADKRDSTADAYRNSNAYLKYNYALLKGVLNEDPRALKILYELGKLTAGKGLKNRYFKDDVDENNLTTASLRDNIFEGLDASGDFNQYQESVKTRMSAGKGEPKGLYAQAAYFNPVQMTHLMRNLLPQPEGRVAYALMDENGQLLPGDYGYRYVDFDPNNPLGYDVKENLDVLDPNGLHVTVHGVRANQDRYLVRDQYGRVKEVTPNFVTDNQLTEMTPEELLKNPFVGFNRPEGIGGKDHFYQLTAEGTDSLLTQQGQQTDGNTGIKNPEMGDYPKPPMWPFLALLGLQVGAMVPSLLKPDYSNADAIINAAKQAGNFTPYNPRYIGNYIAYRPLDRNYESNKLLALTNANARQINNISGGNRGALMAGNLANSYNAGLQLAAVDRQAAEANRLDEFEKFKANRETDIFNATAYNQALRDNQEAASRAMAASLSGLAEGYKMRELIDSERSKALSAGLTNIGTILDTYGRTKFANDLMAWYLPKVGVNWTNDPLDVYLQGRLGAAKGGKLKRRKHSLNF